MVEVEGTGVGVGVELGVGVCDDVAGAGQVFTENRPTLLTNDSSQTGSDCAGEAGVTQFEPV